MTRSYVDAIAGTGARQSDTRKTIPGLRVLETCDPHMGATNHRRACGTRRDQGQSASRSRDQAPEEAVRRAVAAESPVDIIVEVVSTSRGRAGIGRRICCSTATRPTARGGGDRRRVGFDRGVGRGAARPAPSPRPASPLFPGRAFNLARRRRPTSGLILRSSDTPHPLAPRLSKVAFIMIGKEETVLGQAQHARKIGKALADSAARPQAQSLACAAPDRRRCRLARPDARRVRPQAADDRLSAGDELVAAGAQSQGCATGSNTFGRKRALPQVPVWVCVPTPIHRPIP